MGSGRIFDFAAFRADLELAAPKQRNTKDEKRAIKDGLVPDGWKDKPAKLRQIGRDARWTGKYTKAKPLDDGLPKVDLAIPAFGDKNHGSSLIFSMAAIPPATFGRIGLRVRFGIDGWRAD